MLFLFFFSSRRRHTRCRRDWSSDVCSSDLACLVRETLAGASPLADAMFALQALGTVPILLAGHAPLKERWLPRSGERRVGEEGRSRWAPDHLKKKKTKVDSA